MLTTKQRYVPIGATVLIAVIAAVGALAAGANETPSRSDTAAAALTALDCLESRANVEVTPLTVEAERIRYRVNIPSTDTAFIDRVNEIEAECFKEYHAAVARSYSAANEHSLRERQLAAFNRTLECLAKQGVEVEEYQSPEHLLYEMKAHSHNHPLNDAYRVCRGQHP